MTRREGRSNLADYVVAVNADAPPIEVHFLDYPDKHNLIQDFFFGEDLMLRRHDYSVNIAGSFEAAQLTSDYVVANHIHLPTKRRAYTRGPDRRPIMEMLMVAIDFSEVRFET